MFDTRFQKSLVGMEDELHVLVKGAGNLIYLVQSRMAAFETSRNNGYVSDKQFLATRALGRQREEQEKSSQKIASNYAANPRSDRALEASSKILLGVGLVDRVAIKEIDKNSADATFQSSLRLANEQVALIAPALRGQCNFPRTVLDTVRDLLKKWAMLVHASNDHSKYASKAPAQGLVALQSEVDVCKQCLSSVLRSLDEAYQSAVARHPADAYQPAVVDHPGVEDSRLVYELVHSLANRMSTITDDAEAVLEADKLVKEEKEAVLVAISNGQKLIKTFRSLEVSPRPEAFRASRRPKKRHPPPVFASLLFSRTSTFDYSIAKRQAGNRA